MTPYAAGTTDTVPLLRRHPHGRTSGRSAGAGRARPLAWLAMFLNLLPSLRETRGPLAVGAFWLLNLVLITGLELPLERPAGPPFVVKLFELQEVLGVGVFVAALGFIAYLLGSFLYVDPRVTRPGVSRAITTTLETFVPVAVQSALDEREARTAAPDAGR